jgi:hypothetical protein
MASESENNAPSGAFTEVEAAALREVTSGLRRLIEELRSMALPVIKLHDESWIDDYNGISRYVNIHGFLISKNEYPELYEAVRTLLEIVELDPDRIELYITVEDGITIHVERDIDNEYGRFLGVDNKNLSLGFIIHQAKEKAKNYNHEKLKEALHRLLEALEEGEGE